LAKAGHGEVSERDGCRFSLHGSSNRCNNRKFGRVLRGAAVMAAREWSEPANVEGSGRASGLPRLKGRSLRQRFFYN
jgi:hypothetical protein